jgi:hypothetical protein
LNTCSILVELLLGALILLGSAGVALSQPTGDPTIDPIPVFDLDSAQKSIVVRLHFIEGLLPTIVSIDVVPGPNHSRAGNPPFLKVTLEDLVNATLEEFNAWNPLSVFTVDIASPQGDALLKEAIGIIGFPFRPDVAAIAVTDVKLQQLISSADLIPTLHGFCRNNPKDPNCFNVGIVNRPPVCDADGPYKQECTGQTTNVTLDGTRSYDPDSDPLTYTWSGSFGSAAGAVPQVQFSGFGNFTVNLGVKDDFGGTAACSSTVDVVDTTPPTIQSMSASPSILWPPDHKMVPVNVTVSSTDICDPVLACKITEVTSNEPVNGLGDGDMSPDWKITGDPTLRLRAERSGTGNGRIYTITVTCKDTSGNSTSGATTVAVPRDQKK